MTALPHDDREATRTDITIISQDNPLRGWLYRPDPETTVGDVPVIVMAHGFSAVKEMGLDRYAAAFAAEGFAVVVFDHPCFGASAGTPRQEVHPDRQLRAYRDAITWAQGQRGVDGDRVGVWGTSFSGGHAIVLAATDDRVRAAVAQVPFVCPPAETIPDELREILAIDEEARSRGADPITIPVVTDDPAGFGALSPDPASFDWFMAQGVHAPNWRNEVTLASIARLFTYRPIDHAAAVDAPVLLIAARHDVLSPFEFVGRARVEMGSHAELVEMDGGHFDVYGPGFGLSSAAATGWFDRWLRPVA